MVAVRLHSPSYNVDVVFLLISHVLSVDFRCSHFIVVVILLQSIDAKILVEPNSIRKEKCRNKYYLCTFIFYPILLEPALWSNNL